MRVAVSTNLDDAFSQLERGVNAALAVALPRALNKLGDQAKVAGLRKITEVYRIRRSDLVPYFDVRVARPGAVESAIVAKGKGFPLRLFNPVKTDRGIRVTVKGKSFEIPHAFFANLGIGLQVFARGTYNGNRTAGAYTPGRRKAGLGKATGRSPYVPTGERFGKFNFGRLRFPITLLRTMSPPDALSNPEVNRAMMDRVEEQTAKVLKQEIRFASRGAA